jgi:hypothetical protein
MRFDKGCLLLFRLVPDFGPAGARINRTDAHQSSLFVNSASLYLFSKRRRSLLCIYPAGLDCSLQGFSSPAGMAQCIAAQVAGSVGSLAATRSVGSWAKELPKTEADSGDAGHVAMSHCRWGSCTFFYRKWPAPVLRGREKGMQCKRQCTRVWRKA